VGRLGGEHNFGRSDFRGEVDGGVGGDAVGGGSRRYGSVIQGQEMNITIAPTIIMNADMIMVGDHTVEELQASLGRASVDAIQDALECGEISVSGV